MKLFTVKQPGIEMASQTENRNFTEPPHYKPRHFTEPPHHITLQTKPTTIVAEEAVLAKTLVLLPPALIFGRSSKCFDTAI